MAPQETIHGIFRESMGVLALDESPSSLTVRFKAFGVENPSDARARERYRSVILGTPKLNEYISGIIFHEETLAQTVDEQDMYRYCAEQKIIVGVKVDAGLTDFPLFEHEKFTIGLDGLDKRLRVFFERGVCFVKWRSVFVVGSYEEQMLPSTAVIKANIHQLVHFAALSQKNNLVPILEPEILLEGTHTISQSADALSRVMEELFLQLETYRVDISSVILKTSMVLPGKQNPESPARSDEIARVTTDVLRRHVPSTLGGIVFLSGGQTPREATENFDAIMRLVPFPWPMTYSFSRAVQDPVLRFWAGYQGVDLEVRKEKDIHVRELLLHRLRLNSLARDGKYSPTLESKY